MDDTQTAQSSQVQAQPTQPVAGSGYTDPFASIPQKTVPAHRLIPVAPPPNPVSTPHKEFNPHPLPEAAAAHESIPEIPQPVVEAGIEHSPEIQGEKELASQIHQATQQLASVQPSMQPAPSAPIPEQAFSVTRLEAEEGIKTEPPDSGKRWKLVEILKLLKRQVAPPEVL